MSARCHATCTTDRDTGEILCGLVGAWVSACPFAESAEAGMDERDECEECYEDGDREVSDETAINEITVSFSPHDRYEVAHYHALITEAARLAEVYHKRFGDYLNAEAAYLEQEHPDICEKLN